MKRVERARRFLLGRARALSLKVLPLAVLAAPFGAMAGSIATQPGQFSLISQNITQTVNGTSGGSFTLPNSGFSVSSLPVDTNGFQGISLTGSVTVTCVAGQGDQDCSGDQLDLNFTGTVNSLSSSSTILPSYGNLGWNFNVTSNDPGAESYAYSLDGTSESSQSYGSSVIGDGTFTIDQTSGDWSMDLLITPVLAVPGVNFTITFPDDQSPNSLDFSAATPEPSTIGLCLAGAAALGFVRRRRKA